MEMIIKQKTFKECLYLGNSPLENSELVFFLFLSRIREDSETLSMHNRKKKRKEKEKDIAASKRESHNLKLVHLFTSVHYRREIIRSFQIICPKKSKL